MKLVGGDSGHVEREQIVEDVVVAPSERVVIDVLFETAGELVLEHRTPGRVYRLATVTVSEQRAEPALDESFEVLRTNADMAAERERIAAFFDAEADKTLAFIAEMDMGAPQGEGRSSTPARCTRTWSARSPVIAPSAGQLLAAALVAAAGAQEHEHGHEGDGHEHGGYSHSTADGIEWEDDMVEVNRMTTPANMRWKIIDRETGAENKAIDWRFRIGDRIKLRLLNEMAGDHPMHHPFHVHGAGRFLVLSRDGTTEPNLVWKDTVLVRAGETVDILLELTNPGIWMVHCHIAEHHESGMMFSFEVTQWKIAYVIYPDFTALDLVGPTRSSAAGPRPTCTSSRALSNRFAATAA